MRVQINGVPHRQHQLVQFPLVNQIDASFDSTAVSLFPMLRVAVGQLRR